MLNVDYRKVETLIPYARNPRTHSDAQVAKIAASIVEYGWTNPVLVDGDNGVIAGHGRLAAARKLGLDEVPVIELGHLTPAQKRAYVISDNRLALDAGWDRVLSKMKTQRTGKHVVFTELGYDAGPDPAVEPWRTGGGPQGDPLQVSCLRAALEAIDREPAVIGAFLWKWFPEPRPAGRDFRIADPNLQELIRSVWRR